MIGLNFGYPILTSSTISLIILIFFNMSFIGMNSTEGQVKPDVILPPLIVLQEYQTEIEIKCKVKSMTNVTVMWYLASTEDVSNDVEKLNKEPHVFKTNSSLADGCIQVELASIKNPSAWVTDSVMTLFFKTDESCQERLSNSNYIGTCLATNEAGKTRGKFDIKIPDNYGADSDIFSWNFWTKNQKQKHIREKKKALGFIFGMIPPIFVLSYIAFYLSCFRNSANLDANMFGSENL